MEIGVSKMRKKGKNSAYRRQDNDQNDETTKPSRGRCRSKKSSFAKLSDSFSKLSDSFSNFSFDSKPPSSKSLSSLSRKPSSMKSVAKCRENDSFMETTKKDKSERKIIASVSQSTTTTSTLDKSLSQAEGKSLFKSAFARKGDIKIYVVGPKDQIMAASKSETFASDIQHQLRQILAASHEADAKARKSSTRQRSLSRSSNSADSKRELLAMRKSLKRQSSVFSNSSQLQQPIPLQSQSSLMRRMPKGQSVKLHQSSPNLSVSSDEFQAKPRLRMANSMQNLTPKPPFVLDGGSTMNSVWTVSASPTVHRRASGFDAEETTALTRLSSTLDVSHQSTYSSDITASSISSQSPPCNGNRWNANAA